jgi:hypothetical protein
MAGDREQRTRRQIADHRTRRRQIVDRRDARAGDDLAAERREVRRERVGDPLRPAPRDDPARDVRHRTEHERERRRRTPIERQHAVGGDAGEQRACFRLREGSPGERLGGLQRVQPEPRERERMPRQPRRAEHGTFDERPRVDDRSEQPSIRGAVGAESRGRAVDRPVDRRGRPVVERMGEHDLRLDPLEAVLRQR